MDRSEFGHWLRERRVELGLSQAVVAKKLGFSQSAIRLWEQGYNHTSNTERERIVNLLSDEYFLTGENMVSGGKTTEISLELLTRISQTLNQADVQKLEFGRLLAIYRNVEDAEAKQGSELNEEQMSRFVVDT